MAQYVAVRALNRSSQIRLITAVGEVQRLAVDATAGNFTLTYAGQTTANIAFNASASTGGASVRQRLEDLSNIAPGDVIVTGGPGNAGASTPYIIQFVGTLSPANVAQITAADVTLTGGGDSVTVTTTTSGMTGGRKVKLTTTTDQIVDLDLAHNRRELSRHSAFGQYIVTAANADVHANILPANS